MNHSLRTLLFVAFFCASFSGRIHAQLLTWYNFAQHDGNGSVSVRDIAGNDGGDTYYLIQFSEVLILDSDTIPATSDLDFVVVKRDVNEVLQWYRKYTCTDLFGCRSIAADSLGNVYVVGSYNAYDTVTVDSAAATTTTLPVNQETGGFISKFDSNGMLQWNRILYGQVSANQVSIDLNLIRINGPALFVTGLIDGIYDFDPSAGTNPVGSSSGTGRTIIAAYDYNGNMNWAMQFGSYRHYIDYVYFTPNNDILIAGDLTTGTDLDPGPGNDYYTPVGPSDIFITKLDSNALYQWTRRIIANNEQEIHGITMPDDTSFLICGNTNAAFDLDPTSGVCNITYTSGIRNFFGRYNLNSDFISGADVNCGITPEQLFFNGNGEIVIYGGSSPGHYALALFDTAYSYICYTIFGGSPVGCSAGAVYFRYPFTIYIGGHSAGLNNYGNDGSGNVYVSTMNLTGFVAKYYLGWGPMSVSGRNDEGPLPVYPNPAADFCTIDLNGFGGNAVALTLYDINGKPVWRDQTTESVFLLNTLLFAPGTYVLSCEGESMRRTERLVIVH